MRLARLAETLGAINYLQTVGSFGTAAPNPGYSGGVSNHVNLPP